MIYLVAAHKNMSRFSFLNKREDIEIKIVEPGEGGSVLEELSRIPIDTLLLDIDTGPKLGSFVLRFRLLRPDTRIILLACEKTPGDADVARIVQAGVYDVVTDPEKLEEVLNKEPAGLEVVAKWLDPELAPEHEKEKEVVEKIVEKKVAVSNRPVYIAVCGTAPGVGTTKTACKVAVFIAAQKYDTLLVEAGETGMSVIMNDTDIDEGPRPWLPRLDVVRSSKPKEYVRARKWQYIIVDLGVKKADEVIDDEYDLILVVLPEMHRIFRLDDSWNNVCREYITFIAANQDTARYWKRKYRVKVFTLPKDFFAGEWSDVNKSCAGLLQDFLPEKTGSDIRKKVRIAAVLIFLCLPVFLLIGAGVILPDSLIGKLARKLLFFIS